MPASTKIIYLGWFSTNIYQTNNYALFMKKNMARLQNFPAGVSSLPDF
jgi:hypothetical protein